jgi:hypothetical protein
MTGGQRDLVEGWLARLSDPAGLNLTWPAAPIDAGDAATLDALFFEAARHNVGLVWLARFNALLRDEPSALLKGDPSRVAGQATELMARAQATRLQLLGPVMALGTVARSLREDLTGMPVALVKGLDFAEEAYGGVQWRGFSDIDLLVRPDAMAAVTDTLARHGFAPHAHEKQAADYTERQFVRADAHTDYLLVEVHTDLVHTPELRARMSLTYDLYADASAGGITPAARLILAALHGATSHLFGRLQYVVDGMMVARMGVDARELAARADASGALLPLRTMLRLAATIFGCEASAQVLAKLPAGRFTGLEQRLITAPMVLAAKSPHRWRLLARRYLYRRLLRS